MKKKQKYTGKSKYAEKCDKGQMYGLQRKLRNQFGLYVKKNSHTDNA